MAAVPNSDGGFDLSSARPVTASAPATAPSAPAADDGGFDLSTARPVTAQASAPRAKPLPVGGLVDTLGGFASGTLPNLPAMVAGGGALIKDVESGVPSAQWSADIQRAHDTIPVPEPRTQAEEWGREAAASPYNPLVQLERGANWAKDTFVRGAEGVASGDPRAYAKQARLEAWMRGELPGVTQDDLRREGIMPRAWGVNPAEHVALTEAGGALSGLAEGEMLGAAARGGAALARAAGEARRVPFGRPYEVEAESGAPRPRQTVEGSATQVPPKPGAPRKILGPEGSQPAPRALPYHPDDPTLVPANVPSAPPNVKGQSASGLRNGRLLDPVTIDGRTGEVIDHPSGKKPETPHESGGGEGHGTENGGGPPPPRVPIDTPPIGDVGLPDSAMAARAAILLRAGYTQARLSAIAGNALDAADDYWIARTNQPGGVEAKKLVDAEWPTLVRFGDRIVAKLGGTPSLDEGPRESRGITLATPAAGLRDYYRQLKAHVYDLARQRSEKARPTNLQGVDVLLDSGKFKGGLAMKGQPNFVSGVRDILAEARKRNKNGFTPEAAEEVSKELNANWTPDTAWAIRQINDAIREDVARSAGEDIYQVARGVHKEEQQVFPRPKSKLGRLFETHPEDPDERVVEHEAIPGAAMKLPLAQFRRLVSFYDGMPKLLKRQMRELKQRGGTPEQLRALQKQSQELQRNAQAALAELRSQFVNELVAAGSPSVDDGAWSTPKVKAFLRKNSAKFEVLFGDLPEATQQIRDLISSGQINRINRGYPGAGIQNTNVFNTGVVVGGIRNATALAGGIAGAALGHGPEALGLGAAGMAGGRWVGGKLTDAIDARGQVNRWQDRVVNLADIAPPASEAGPAPAPAPKAPRQPKPRKPPDAGTPPPSGGTPTPAAPAGGTPAPAAPAGTPGAFPTQGYTRAGYDQAKLARELGVDPRAVGDRALMLHNEAERAEQAGDGPRAASLRAERDSLVDRSLQAQGLPPRQPPPPPNTLASTETPPATPAAPASTPPTLASTEGPPALAPREAPVAAGPTLASVSEPAPDEIPLTPEAIEAVLGPEEFDPKTGASKNPPPPGMTREQWARLTLQQRENNPAFAGMRERLARDQAETKARMAEKKKREREVAERQEQKNREDYQAHKQPGETMDDFLDRRNREMIKEQQAKEAQGLANVNDPKNKLADFRKQLEKAQKALKNNPPPVIQKMNEQLVARLQKQIKELEAQLAAPKKTPPTPLNTTPPPKLPPKMQGDYVGRTVEKVYVEDLGRDRWKIKNPDGTYAPGNFEGKSDAEREAEFIEKNNLSGSEWLHGTSGQFEEFSPAQFGKVYDDPGSRSGVFFTSHPLDAAGFARASADRVGGTAVTRYHTVDTRGFYRLEESDIRRAENNYSNARNGEENTKDYPILLSTNLAIAEAKKSGRAGVIVPPEFTINGEPWIVVFDRSRIGKLAATKKH